MKSVDFGPMLNGGRCTANTTSLTDSDAFIIGAHVPDLGFRCGCFPNSNTNIKKQRHAGLISSWPTISPSRAGPVQTRKKTTLALFNRTNHAMHVEFWLLQTASNVSGIMQYNLDLSIPRICAGSHYKIY